MTFLPSPVTFLPSRVTFLRRRVTLSGCRVTARAAVCAGLALTSVTWTPPAVTFGQGITTWASRQPSREASLRVTISDESGAWLETRPLAVWNTSGADVPIAPPSQGDPDPRCGSQERSSESPEEDQVAVAGWHIYNVARVGWGLRIVDGLVDYDGMCRPLAFQTFVFADGTFAGTISPTTMASRSDGAGRITNVRGPDHMMGTFVRYGPTDPLCCPSKTFNVDYTVDRDSPDGPVLVGLTSTQTPAPAP